VALLDLGDREAVQARGLGQRFLGQAAPFAELAQPLAKTC